MTLLFLAFVNASSAFVKGFNYKVQEAGVQTRQPNTETAIAGSQAVVQRKALQKDLLKKKTEFLDHVPASVTALRKSICATEQLRPGNA